MITIFLVGCAPFRPGIVDLLKETLPPTDVEELQPTPTPTDIPTPIEGCSYKYSKKHKNHVYKCKRKDEDNEERDQR